MFLNYYVYLLTINIYTDAEAGNGNTAAAVVSQPNGTFSSSIFGEYTDIIIFVMLAFILCCILVCCFIFLIHRRKKKEQMKRDIAALECAGIEMNAVDVMTPTSGDNMSTGDIPSSTGVDCDVDGFTVTRNHFAVPAKQTMTEQSDATEVVYDDNTKEQIEDVTMTMPTYEQANYNMSPLDRMGSVGSMSSRNYPHSVHSMVHGIPTVHSGNFASGWMVNDNQGGDGNNNDEETGYTQWKQDSEANMVLHNGADSGQYDDLDRQLEEMLQEQQRRGMGDEAQDIDL